MFHPNLGSFAESSYLAKELNFFFQILPWELCAKATHWLLFCESLAFTSWYNRCFLTCIPCSFRVILIYWKDVSVQRFTFHDGFQRGFFFKLSSLSIYNVNFRCFWIHLFFRSTIIYVIPLVPCLLYAVYFGGFLIPFIIEKMGMMGSVPPPYG